MKIKIEMKMKRCGIREDFAPFLLKLKEIKWIFFYKNKGFFVAGFNSKI